MNLQIIRGRWQQNKQADNEEYANKHMQVDKYMLKSLELRDTLVEMCRWQQNRVKKHCQERPLQSVFKHLSQSSFHFQKPFKTDAQQAYKII